MKNDRKLQSNCYSPTCRRAVNDGVNGQSQIIITRRIRKVSEVLV